MMEASEMTPAVGRDLSLLWRDEGVQCTFLRSSEFQLNDSVG